MLVVSVAVLRDVDVRSPMMSIKVVNSLTLHRLDHRHVHSGALGWVGFVSFGAL